MSQIDFAYMWENFAHSCSNEHVSFFTNEHVSFFTKEQCFESHVLFNRTINLKVIGRMVTQTYSILDIKF